MSDLPKIGIDIGSTSVKIAELSPNGNNSWKLIAAGSANVPTGGVLGGVGNVTHLAQTLSTLIKESGAKSKRCVLSLPEEHVSSHVVELPPMDEKDIGAALQWQVEQYIPIPIEKAIWSYEVIKNSLEGVEILLVAAAKNLVATYSSVVEHAGLELLAVETELMATSRAVVAPENDLVVVMDIGAVGTDIGVVKGGQLVFSRTISTAGNAFTRAIETGLSIDTATAEQYKNAYGFSTDKLDGKLLEAMKPVLTIIATEARKTIDFYASKHTGQTVRSVILSGGVALLPGAIGTLSAMAGVEMAIGNPFTKISLNEKQSVAFSGHAPLYCVALGLAQRPV